MCVIVFLSYWTNKFIIAVQNLSQGKSNKISMKFNLSYYIYMFSRQFTCSVIE